MDKHFYEEIWIVSRCVTALAYQGDGPFVKDVDASEKLDKIIERLTAIRQGLHQGLYQ